MGEPVFIGVQRFSGLGPYPRMEGVCRHEIYFMEKITIKTLLL